MLSWIDRIAKEYVAGTGHMFVLSGNVYDTYQNGTEYCSLVETLSSQLLGKYHVYTHDLASGLKPYSKDPKKIAAMMASANIPSTQDNDKVLFAINELLEKNIIAPANERHNLAFIFNYAQFMAPSGDPSSLSRSSSTNLIRLLSWAKNPLFKKMNIVFILVSDRQSEINNKLTQSPYVVNIDVPLPDEKQTEGFVSYFLSSNKVELKDVIEDIDVQGLTKQSNGLTLVNLGSMLEHAKKEKMTVSSFSQVKMRMIEQQCINLVEMIHPKVNLDYLSCSSALKQRLLDDVNLIKAGKLDYVPMGYLVSGPVGTGKTFLSECFAGSIGIPAARIKNFRSKYVGESEGNLEVILNTFKSLGPILVIIDEADAALGDRDAEGDSGTSSRIFSMIASQMGNTEYRGKIIWMLMTARPDLLPIDIKRQGRAEVHIPLFYPESNEEIDTMFKVMSKKNDIEIKAASNTTLINYDGVRGYSGADIESILMDAKRRSIKSGTSYVSYDQVNDSIAAFLPSSQSMEKEMQELASVLECTDLSFLNAKWKSAISEKDARKNLQSKFIHMRNLCE